MGLAQKNFSDIITFTRASAATRINHLGQLETVGNNVPRIDYDPVTLGCRGILIEEQRTNMLLNSATLSTQSVAVTGLAKTLSFTGTGSIALSGAHTATLNGTGANNRVSLTLTPSAGPLTLTATGDVRRAQLEVGGFATSWIPTTGAQATRAADVCSINTLSPWFNQSESTIYYELNTPHAGLSPLTDRVDITMVGVSWINTAHHTRTFSSQSRTLGIYDGAMQQFSGVSSVTRPIAAHKVAYAVKQNDCVLSMDGGISLVDTTVNIPTVSVMHLGHSGAGANNLCGHIRKLRYFPRRLTNAQLQALTA